MNSYFVTIAANMSKGAGYYEVLATDLFTARDYTCNVLGEEWCFMYDLLEEVHPLDRKKHGTIYVNGLVE